MPYKEGSKSHKGLHEYKTLDATEVTGPILEPSNGLDVGEFVEEILDKFGGMKGFAVAFFEEFQLGKAGSISRAKQLEAVLRMVDRATSQGMKSQKDTAVLSQDELEQELFLFLKKKGLKVVPADEPPLAAPPG